jgi:protein-S-isoprenylcysteine O-methyltransferase Ste14
MNEITGGGEAVITETQEDRDRATLRIPRPASVAVLPHHIEYVTAQVDPPKVVARDRAIPLAVIVGVISLTGSLAAVLPIDPEWLPAVGVVLAAINAAAAYWYRTQVEGSKDQARAEKV